MSILKRLVDHEISDMMHCLTHKDHDHSFQSGGGHEEGTCGGENRAPLHDYQEPHHDEENDENIHEHNQEPDHKHKKKHKHNHDEKQEHHHKHHEHKQ